MPLLYSSRSQASHQQPRFINHSDMVPTHTTTDPDGLYPSLPSVLDVWVNREEPEIRSGLYSKIHWKPDEQASALKESYWCTYIVPIFLA